MQSQMIWYYHSEADNILNHNMKQKSKNNHLGVKCVFFTGLLFASFSSMAQKPSVTADPELGKIVLTDVTGFPVDANYIQPDQVINLQIPVLSDAHGKDIPAGSCKIKIGFGSKLALDPLFNINNTGLSNYFNWTSSTVGGQTQVTGELVTALPASITSVNVSFKVKASLEGKSTITANFLITNHNTNTILSDEDGSNNAASLAYAVTGKVARVSAAGALKLNLYPNPAKDVKAVMLEVVQGELKGKYSINLLDLSGKTIQTKQADLNGVPSFSYDFGNIAAGKYLVKVTSSDGTQTVVLKFEKL
jgi:hypothetical protein